MHWLGWLLPASLTVRRDLPAVSEPQNFLDSLDCTSGSLALRTVAIRNVRVLVDMTSPSDGPAAFNYSTSVVFQLFNPATEIEAQCAGYFSSSNPLQPGSSSTSQLAAAQSQAEAAAAVEWHDCFLETRLPGRTAAFQFDGRDGGNVLGVNVTWECGSEGGLGESIERSIRFEATGEAELPLTCSEVDAASSGGMGGDGDTPGTTQHACVQATGGDFEMDIALSMTALDLVEQEVR